MERKKVSIIGLFGFADTLDYLLMFMGSVGACVHGAGIPLFFFLFGRMIDSIGRLSSDPDKFFARVTQDSLYLVYIGLITFFTSWMGVAFWMQTGERQTGRLRSKYLKAILKKDIEFFDTEAEKINLMSHISSDAVLVQDAIGDKIGHSIRYLSHFALGFLLGFMSGWKLALVAVASIPLFAIAGGAYGLTISRLSRKAEAAYAESDKVAGEVISNIRTVQAFVGENRAVEKYSTSLQKALKLGTRSGFAKGIGIGFTYALLFCAVGLFLLYASVLVISGQTTGGKTFSTFSNIVYSAFALGQATPNLASIAKAQAAASNIISIIESYSDIDKSSECGITLPTMAGEIEFRQVCFAYPSRPTKLIFQCLSFSVNAGKSSAIVGTSGLGKSTIISLLQRFYHPSSGSILLDGHDLGNMQLEWVRKQMALVNQEPTLFATTILDNILYGKEDADMEQVIEAAKSANAHSFIQSLPDGYSTHVGEGGAQLSGGQKQRVAIARALLRNPKILLLDEATSALDAESEFAVQKALDQAMVNRTTIIVAHRLSTIRDVDQIIVLGSNGEVELISKENSDNRGGSRCPRLQLIMNPPPMDEDESSNEQRPQGIIMRTNYNETKEGNNNNPSLKKLVMLNKEELPYAVLGSIGAMLAGVEPPFFALGITYMVTTFYSNDNSRIKHDVRITFFIFLGFAIITIPIYILQQYYYTLMGERITTRVRLSMFSAMLSNEVGWFNQEENSVGSLTSKLEVDATLIRIALVDRLSLLVQNTTLIVAAFVISFTFSWRVSLVIVAVYPFFIGASIAEQAFLKGFGGDYSSGYSEAHCLAREAIANIRIVAAFGIEDIISNQFLSYLNKSKKKVLLRGHIAGFCYGISQLLVFCAYAIALWYGSVLAKHGDEKFENVVKAFFVLLMTAIAVAETLALTPEIMRGLDATGSVFNILGRKTGIDSDDPNSTVMTAMKGDVEFKDVSFEYPTRVEVRILKELNLKITSGRSLAVVGKSGSGKSTLISLVMRFYDPCSGSVLVDGYDIRTINLKSLRRRISLVQQEPPLFSTTIYENIRYGNEGATQIEIVEAAKVANAHDFILRLPDGYDTLVGEKGSQLSGGQKQRVAIARAIVKDPSILLLDEATSALDSLSEKVVQEAIDRVMQRRTTIIVAHRLSTICDADCIAVLQDGKVAEMGTHEELISTSKSLYGQLVSLQQETKQLS